MGRAAIAGVRGENTSTQAEELDRQILRHLGCSSWSEVDAKASAGADAVYPRVFPVVAASSDAGNSLAQSLLRSAAENLAALAHRLAESLGLVQANLPLGKTRGTIAR